MNRKKVILLIGILNTFGLLVTLHETQPSLTLRAIAYIVIAITIVAVSIPFLWVIPANLRCPIFDVYKQRHCGKEYFVLKHTYGNICAERGSLPELAEVIRKSFSLQKFPKIYINAGPDFEIEVSRGKNPLLNIQLTDEEVKELFIALEIK